MYDHSHPAFRGSNRLYTYFCTTCDRDTPHQKGCCLYCKTESKSPVVEHRRNVIKQKQRVAKAVGMKFGSSDMARVAIAAHSARLQARIRKDKREFLRRQAEASRAKFEGRA